MLEKSEKDISVVVDMTPFFLGDIFSGRGIYTYNLASFLGELTKFKVKYSLEAVSFLSLKSISNFRKMRRKIPKRKVSFQLGKGKFGIYPKGDIFHCVGGFIPPKGKMKRVLTIHTLDAFDEDKLENINHREKKQAEIKRVIENEPECIIFPSRYMEEKYLELFDYIPPIRRVIYNTAPPEFIRAHSRIMSKRKMGMEVGVLKFPKNYILILFGSEDKEGKIKMTLSSIRKIAGLLKEKRKLILIMAENEKVIRKIYSFGFTDIMEISRVIPSANLEVMPYIYMLSYALLYQGHSEDMGFHLINAMMCGTPVLASDEPEHKEICDDSAMYFCSTSSDNIGSTIEELLKDQERRKELSEKALTRAEKFYPHNFIHGIKSSYLLLFEM